MAHAFVAPPPTVPVPEGRIVLHLPHHGLFQADVNDVVLRLMHPARVLRSDVRGLFPESFTAREVAVMHKLTMAIILCQE